MRRPADRASCMRSGGGVRFWPAPIFWRWFERPTPPGVRTRWTQCRRRRPSVAGDQIFSHWDMRPKAMQSRWVLPGSGWLCQRRHRSWPRSKSPGSGWRSRPCPPGTDRLEKKNKISTSSIWKWYCNAAFYLFYSIILSNRSIFEFQKWNKKKTWGF